VRLSNELAQGAPASDNLPPPRQPAAQPPAPNQ
jgi:hypothetical protein